MDEIDFGQWQSAQLKVGKIVQVERIEGADKLYKLQVDIGEESARQIVSGLVPYYTEEELLGKQVVVVTNLKPATFRGVESRGMLLAAGNNKQDTCVLLTAEKEIEPGTEIS